MKRCSRPRFAICALFVATTLPTAAGETAALESPTRLLAEGVRLEEFAVGPGGTKLFGYSRESGVLFIDSEKGQTLAQLPLDPTGTGPIAFANTGLVAAGGPQRRSLRLWKPPASEVLQTLTTPAEPFNAIAFSHDGQWLAAADQDGLITLWNSFNGELVHRLNGHIASVSAMAFSPDGGQVVTAGDDNDICIWDTKTGRLVRRIASATHTVFALVWSGDGDRVYAGGASCSVTVWNATTGGRMADSAGGPHVISSLALSPDGRTLAAGGFNPESSRYPADIRLLDASTLAEQRVIHAHSGPVATLAFSGDQLLSASPTDPGIKVWSLAPIAVK